MNRYFGSFALIDYDGKLVINITERAAILNKLFGDRNAFYPYVVKNGMRPDLVAEKYYGDPDFAWLVYLSNNIVDPYNQWPMDEDTLQTNIEKKYGSLSAARNKIVTYRVNWYEDTRKITKAQYSALPVYEKKYWTPDFDNDNMPLYYARKKIDFMAVAQDADGNVTLSIPEEEQSYWSGVTAFDLEQEENAKKSYIRLLDSRLAQTAASNLRQLLGE